MVILGQAGLLQRGQPRAQAGRGRDVGQHFHQQVLDELEAPDRAAELLALPGVGQRVLISAAGAAGGLPGDPGPGQPQHRGGVLEGVRPLQPVLLRDPDPVQRDMRVLHHPQRDLVFLLGGLEARRALLDHEPLDLVVFQRTGPDDHVVGKGGVPDPLLLPVQDPFGAVAPGRGGQAAGHARTDVGFGEPEGADLLHPRHLGQPAFLLLFGAAQVDGAHGQAAVHAEERPDRRVHPGQLHRDHAVQQEAATGAAVALVQLAGDAELAEVAHQVVRELLPGPVVVDDGLDRLLHELPDPVQELAALGFEGLLEQVEVGVGDGGAVSGWHASSPVQRRATADRKPSTTGASSEASVTRAR